MELEYPYKLYEKLMSEWIEKCISFISLYCPNENRPNAMNLLYCSIARSKYLTLNNLNSIISKFPQNNKMIWYYLSLNKNLFKDMLEKQLIESVSVSKPRPWNLLFQNCCASQNIVENVNPLITVPNKQWVYYCINKNSGLTIDVILKYPNLNWDWDDISGNIGITMEDIENTLTQLPWNWRGISRNKNLTIDMLLKYQDQKWNMKHVSMNSGISMRDIEGNRDIKWDWNGVVRNINFEFYMIEKYPYVNWNMNAISRNLNLKLTDVLAHPDMAWNWDAITKNPSIDLYLLLNNNNIPWYWYDVCKNPSIDLNLMKLHPNAPWNWDWNGLSENNGLTMDMIEAYPNKEWIWSLVFLPRFLISNNSFNRLFCPDEYISQNSCKLNLLSMHDEDYERGEECLDYDNNIDLVIQSQYMVSCIAEYV